MPPSKVPRSFTITDEAFRLLWLLAAKRGINRTATLESIIREEAERRGVTLPVDQDGSKVCEYAKDRSGGQTCLEFEDMFVGAMCGPCRQLATSRIREAADGAR